MDARQNQRGRWSWCCAALLSVALHALLVLPFLLVPWQGHGNGGHGLLKLDTRARMPAVELLLVLHEPQPAPAKLASHAPPTPEQSPRTIPQPAPEAPRTGVKAEVSTRTDGSTEEQ